MYQVTNQKFVAIAVVLAVLLSLALLLLPLSSSNASPLRCSYDPGTGAFVGCGDIGGTTEPGTDPGQPGSTPGPGAPPPTPQTVTCNNNGSCEAGEYYPCDNCPPPPSPTPWNPGAENAMTFHCVPWPSCTSGWADVISYYDEDSGHYFAGAVICLDEEECVLPTPEPGLPPDPGTDWPCDDPPNLGSGEIIQWATECDWGCETCATARIPPAMVLRNPWPRGLCGLPNKFWYIAPNDVEKWSDECKPCPNAADGMNDDEDTWDCGNGNIAGEDDEYNYQIGVAWRHWEPSDGRVFAGASTPLAEHVWAVHDREWNGGDKFIPGGNLLEYTFETSSYGLELTGPTWNRECQERVCDCDERILDTRGTEAYDVGVQTFWWPEWNIKWLEYKCVQMGDPICKSAPCTDPSNCPEDECSCERSGDRYCKLKPVCILWGWRQREEGWTEYDIRGLGYHSPYVGWSNAIVAGADPDGNKCTQTIGGGSGWIDSGNVPVPIIELQPVAP